MYNFFYSSLLMNSTLIVNMIINQLSGPWWRLIHDELHCKENNIYKWLSCDHWDHYLEDKIS